MISIRFLHQGCLTPPQRPILGQYIGENTLQEQGGKRSLYLLWNLLFALLATVAKGCTVSSLLYTRLHEAHFAENSGLDDHWWSHCL